MLLRSASFAGRVVRPACRSLGGGRSIVLWRARARALRGCTPGGPRARMGLATTVPPCRMDGVGRKGLPMRLSALHIDTGPRANAGREWHAYVDAR